MSKFSVTFEDESLEGLQRQIIGYLMQFNGFSFFQEAKSDDNRGEDPMVGEPSE